MGIFENPYGYIVEATHPTTGERSTFWYHTELRDEARRFARQLETDLAHNVVFRRARPEDVRLDERGYHL